MPCDEGAKVSRPSASTATILILASTMLQACHRRSRAPENAAAHRLPFSFTSKSIELPRSQRIFKRGAAARAANQYCLRCHSMGMISIQPPFNRKTWLAEINKMRTAFNCPVPQDQIPKLADFLYKEGRLHSR
jgi:hypothetical protein